MTMLYIIFALNLNSEHNIIIPAGIYLFYNNVWKVVKVNNKDTRSF